VPPLYIEIFIFEKHLDFWWNFEVSSLDRFWQFWAEFAALRVAESLPEVWLKSLEFHNS
jgi:hypothetical protein